MKVCDPIRTDPNPGAIPQLFELSDIDRGVLNELVQNLTAQYSRDFLGRRWPDPRSKFEVEQYVGMRNAALTMVERGFGQMGVVDLIAGTIEGVGSTIGRKPYN